MYSTYETIKQASKRLPHYLDKINPDLAKEFLSKLDTFPDLFAPSCEAQEEAAKTLYKAFNSTNELNRILLNLHTFPETKKEAAFFECVAEVRRALTLANYLDEFLDDLNLQTNNKNDASQSKSQKSDSAPKFSYSCIRRYQEEFPATWLEPWKNQDLADGRDELVNLATVRKRNLLEECIHTPEGDISYQNFYKEKVVATRGTVIALCGKLGIGKSLLIQYIVCDIISTDKNNVILLIGQRSSASSESGKQLICAFKDKLIRRENKKRRFYLIIDEPEADQMHWGESDWRKLNAAANYYSAKIILLIRDGSSDKKLLQYFSVGSENITYLQEAQSPVPMPAGWQNWIDPKKIPCEYLDDLRQLPLFRLSIDNCLWRLENQTIPPGSMLRKYFRNTYALLDDLYVTRLRDKEAQTGANRNTGHGEQFYNDCDSLFQFAAFKLWENGGSVSWNSGTPGQLDKWKTLLDDGFVENILQVQSRKGQQSQNTIIGFQHEPLYHYFGVREFRERIVSGKDLEQTLMLLINNLDCAPDRNILVDGLCDLSNDKKSQGIQNLNRLKKTNRAFSKAQYKEVLNSLIELLNC